VADDAVMQTDPAVRATAKAMLDVLGPLAEHVTARVWHGVPGYQSVLMDPADLGGYVGPNLLSVLTSVAEDHDVTESELARARHAGNSRALQGVPLDALIQSFRTAERATVDQFCEFHAKVGGSAESQRRGIQQISAVLDAIEGPMVAAYQETRRRIALHYESAMGDLVTQIALGQGVSETELDRLASILAVDPEVPYQATAARLAHDPADGVLGQLRHHVTSRLREVAHGPVLTGTWRDILLFLVPVPVRDIPVADVLTRALAPDQCRYEVIVGLGSPAPRLIEAAGSCRQAMDALEIAMRTGRSREAVHYDDVLVDLLLVRDHGLTTHLAKRGLAGLVDQPHLVQTLRVYLDSGPSASDTAKALSVHQNTVNYRLRRIRELTGYDPRNIDNLLLLRLALRAQDLLAVHS
jgi:PucR-like helix-turn-helix protein/diguanylate cyclase with GGDEF domain